MPENSAMITYRAVGCALGGVAHSGAVLTVTS